MKDFLKMNPVKLTLSILIFFVIFVPTMFIYYSLNKYSASHCRFEKLLENTSKEEMFDKNSEIYHIGSKMGDYVLEISRMSILIRYSRNIGLPSAIESCELGLSDCRNYLSQEDFDCIDFSVDSPMPFALSRGKGNVSLWFETFRAILWGFIVYLLISLINIMNQSINGSDYDRRKVRLFRSAFYAVPIILYIASFVLIEFFAFPLVLRTLLLLFIISFYSSEFVRVFRNKKYGSYVLIAIYVVIITVFLVWLYLIPAGLLL